MLLALILFPALSLAAEPADGSAASKPLDVPKLVFPVAPTANNATSTEASSSKEMSDAKKRMMKGKKERKDQMDRRQGRARLGGCDSSQLSRIMQRILNPLLSRSNSRKMRLGDIAYRLQQVVQKTTGKSHEIFMGKGDMITSSHQMSETSHCRVRVGDYYTMSYETPVQYNINDVAAEKIMSNIDFGENLGGSGYEGQLPFPRYDQIYTPNDQLYYPADRFAYPPVEQQPYYPPAQPYYPPAQPYYPAAPIVPVVPLECFSGDLIVETVDGPKRMADLKTGDEVLSVQENMIIFSPIIMFLHRDEDQMAELNVITTANGDSVKLTNEHLIYVTNCDPRSPLRLVRAQEVTTDHCLMAARAPVRKLTIDRVTNVTKTHERGIYAPLTSTGDIIVNDVYSSCHSNLAARTIQQFFFGVYRSIHRSLSFIMPEEGALPLGVGYLLSSFDVFIPTKMV